MSDRTSDPRSPALALAERVAEAASSLGIETALVGAAAMAVHHHARATKDVTLATAVQPGRELPKLAHTLRSLGLQAKVRMPNDHDPLGGLVVVWTSADADGDPIAPVEVINFDNPYRPQRNPGRDAIQRARAIEGSALRVVTLPDLIALKLYAGGRRDHADVVDLLVANPDADLDELRATAKHFGGAEQLETLITEALEVRRR